MRKGKDVWKCANSIGLFLYISSVNTDMSQKLDSLNVLNTFNKVSVIAWGLFPRLEINILYIAPLWIF